jgi:hypothetical protein
LSVLTVTFLSGPDAPPYKHDAFKATGDSLVSVKNLTKQLGQILGSLEHSWLQAHSEEPTVTAESKEELLGIAQMLDDHVNDVRSHIVISHRS